MPRLFIAVDLPEDVRESVSKLCFGIPGARWVQQHQLHLTLRFIGETNGNTFLDIQEELARINARDFQLRLQGVGHFPPRGQPKVLWAGVERTDRLVELKKKIDRAVSNAGIENEDRKFYPHITLAGLSNTPEDWVGRFIQGNNLFSSRTFPIDEFHLYSSVLGADGAKHSIEMSYPLHEHTNSQKAVVNL